MNRTLAVLGGGVVLGIIATLAFLRLESPGSELSGEVVRDIVDVPRMTEAVAEQHRDEQYANLVSIEEILALPTRFARQEALHVLAGRSDSGGVQSLVFEANRIADEVEREALLEVLFQRLAEIDPQSALALSRVDEFAGFASLERTVWHTWAWNDLDDAIFAAKTQTTLAYQRRAARSLYEAFGYLGNETIDRIEAELQIKPDRRTRGLYLYRLADKSPSEAIAYINGLDAGRERQENISWLAYYLSLDDPADALRYANEFESERDSRIFSTVLEGNIALRDPAAAVEQMLAGGSDRRSWGRYHNAIRDLAASDLESAKRYFERATSDQHRQILGSAIVAELAKDDPAEALAWARANDRGRIQVFEMAALAQIAQEDLQLALAEAIASPNERIRPQLLSNLVQQVAMSDPQSVIPYIDQIQDQEQRLDVQRHLADAWIRRDADAAVEWMLSQDKETAQRLIAQTTGRLLHNDIDKAIELLPHLDDANQLNMRHSIARQLGENRSVDEAQAFIRRYQAEPDYDKLQATVATGMARNDPIMARQLADQIQDSATRDMAYVQIIGQQARTDPAEALRLLDNVKNVSMRSEAVGQVATQWYATDPTGAIRWVSSLPRGIDRDNTIMQMASRWREPTAEQTNLIASIEDQAKRSQAKLSQIYSIARTDPARARAMLHDDDFTEEQRRQAEQMITQVRVRY